ncbi:MAG: SpoIID/LytB domain-containing protein [Phycisphaeraceae bacterium]|nr:SpoIID/LytB domain-containing protein [Phycisphaerae bacterium]MBX3393440.1 SpoIID/LytB domain-containing protein [Phycisphaeraceae bacterium]
MDRNRGSRSAAGRRRLSGVRRRGRRLATAAFSSATALAVLALSAVVLSVWSCSSFDPVGGKRRPPVAGWPGDAPSDRPVTPLYESEPEIRVRIREPIETVRVESASGLLAASPAGRPSRVTGSAVVTAPNGAVRMTLPDGGFYEFPAGATVTITPADGPQVPATVRIDGTEYPGQISIRPRSDSGSGLLEVIATMPIEVYLPGVLSKELFANWPLAAYEAQAVCARTYALFQRSQDRAAGRAYDVESTQADQVFGGATANRTALEAVKSTRGMLLTYEGAIFKTYYSSTCGGRSASAADVWPTTRGFEYNLAAPIQGAPREHYCQAARLYRWETIRTTEELAKRLAAWGRHSGHAVRSVGTVATVAVEKLNQTGRPSRYTVIDDRGRSFSLSGEELRVACNFAAQGFPPITPPTRVNSNDLEFTPIAGSGVPTFQVRGRGFGHGVGMCQWCLKGLADRGVPWENQVLLFYPGARVVRAYR